MIRYLFTLTFLLLTLTMFPAQVNADTDYQRARDIGELLVELFTPESIEVTVSDGENFAWIEATGAVIDKMRVENLKLRAMIKNSDEPIDKKDGRALAKLILMSRGELTLLEKDVNKLFQGEIETKGFSNLVFDFEPTGFKAEGLFTATFIFTIRIRLRALGTLALQDDGIYIENVKIYTEGVQQPDGLVSMITGRINPLLSFSKIPFPIEFKKLEMTEDAVILTGYPEPFKGGKTWIWHK